MLTGVKTTGVLLDELHEIAKVAAAERIIGQLRGGPLPTPEGFLVFITTQSDEPPRGAFRVELALARAIRDGREQGAMLPVLLRVPGGHRPRPGRPAGVAGFQELVDGDAQPRSVGHR
ncbi:MAG: hypothetical protein AB7U95_34105 [Reyranella sp.]